MNDLLFVSSPPPVAKKQQQHPYFVFAMRRGRSDDSDVDARRRRDMRRRGLEPSGTPSPDAHVPVLVESIVRESFRPADRGHRQWLDALSQSDDDRRGRGGPSSEDNPSACAPFDTPWTDVCEGKPFRITQQCGWDLVKPWHPNAVRGLCHTMPPSRLCRDAEHNYEHFMYPLWKDPAIREAARASGAAHWDTEDALLSVMDEMAPDLAHKARAQRAARAAEAQESTTEKPTFIAPSTSIPSSVLSEGGGGRTTEGLNSH
jgi:hypothetical protein